MVGADIGHDTAEPRPQAVVAAEVGEAPVRTLERLLDSVLGFEAVAYESLCACNRLAGSSYPCGHCLVNDPAELGVWTFSPTKQLSVPRGKGTPKGPLFRYY
jgi:hypothetical protein